MGSGVHPPQSHGPAPGALLRLLEARAFPEHYAAIVTRAIWSAAPRGDGHPVLVLPGLAAGDATTVILRRFLKTRGYAASGWGQGLNLGLRPGVLEHARDTLRALYLEHGRTVSVVGWSLGGLYARELAKLSPEIVRLVITLGSPDTRGRPTHGVFTNSPAAIASVRMTFMDHSGLRRLCRRRRSGVRTMESCPGAAASRHVGIWRRISRSIRATSALGRTRPHSTRSPTGFPNRKAIGSPSIGEAGDALSIAIPGRCSPGAPQEPHPMPARSPGARSNNPDGSGAGFCA